MEKHLLALATLSTLAWQPAAAQEPATLTKHERDFAMSHLHATRKRFQDSITGLSEAQWKFKPGPDRWSIAECAEHIARSEDFLFGILTEKVMKAPPASPEQGAQTRGNDEQVLKFIVDRTKKAQAPEPLRPTGSFGSPEQVLKAFNASRDRTVAYVENTQEDLRAHVAPVPEPVKLIDAYQWVLVISGHSARHTAQIEEVKAAPNYPK